MSMVPAPGIKKPAAKFRIAAGSLKVLCFFSGHQHIVFKLRQSALLKKEEAVCKGEKEKCTSAIHDLGYYRGRQNACQDFLDLGFIRVHLCRICAIRAK